MSVTTGKYIYVNVGTSAVTRGGVTIQPGNDTTGTGAAATPYKTVQKALDELRLAGNLLSFRRVIWITGASQITEKVTIPDFYSSLGLTFSVPSSMTPVTDAEAALTLYGDLDYNSSTSVTVSSWNAETVGSSGMQQVVVSGLSVAADALRGKLLLGTSAYQMAWIGRNDATSGGLTRLYVSTDTSLSGTLKVTSPIELRNLSTSTGEAITAQNLRASLAINGLRVTTQNGERSLGLREVDGEVWIGGSDLNRGFLLRNCSVTYFYQSRLSSGAGAGNSADATYSTVNEEGPGVSYDYCLFDVNSFMDTNTDKAYYACYFRGCNDMGHGGGTYLAAGQYDFSYCYVDGFTGQGSGHIWNYNGGPPCNIDNCSIHPGTGGSGVCAREWGGLRVKEVKGSVAGWGISVGVQASPMLGGSGTVRISTGTTITGTSGDFRLGDTNYATGYTTLRALPSGARRMTNATYFATIWENS